MAYSGTLYGALENKDLRAINHCFERSEAATETGCLGERKVVKYGTETVGLNHVMNKVRTIYAEFSQKDLPLIAESSLDRMKEKAEEFEGALSQISLEGPPSPKEELSLFQWLIQLVESIFHQLMHSFCGL